MRRLLLVAALVWGHGLLWASSSMPMEETLAELGQTAEWRRQLFLQTEGNGPGQPRITDSDFYFSQGDVIDPVDEIKATYQALFDRLDEVDEHHPICQYPARFLFLSEALNRHRDFDILAHCRLFREWSKFDEQSRVLLVMVDGYYGNPASSFGHLIVRLSSPQSDRRLLDTSINYGARIPEGEGAIKYIAKGLTGGYLANFTLEEFYRQDLVYTRTEYRDMWNYELNLTEAQRLRFVAQIWELMGHPATYYFLKNNCAFAVAEALEIVLNREILDQQTAWYPPVVLFQTLEDENSRSGGTLIKGREFVPSQKRKMAAMMRSLTPSQADSVLAYINNPEVDPSNYLAAHSSEAAAAILEALIEYYDYLAEGYPEIGTELYERRRRLLIARLGYQAGRTLSLPSIKESTPVGQTAKTRRIAFGTRHTQAGLAGLIGFTPFQIAPTDKGNPDLSELTLLSGQLAFNEAIELDDLTIMRVSQRSDIRQSIPGDRTISWTLDFGFNCIVDCEGQEGLRGRAGVGQSVRTGPLMLSGLVYARQAGRYTLLEAVSEAGLPETAGWSGRLELGYQWNLHSFDASDWVARMEGRYSVNTEHSIGVEVGRESDRFESRLNWYWHLQ